MMGSVFPETINNGSSFLGRSSRGRFFTQTQIEYKLPRPILQACISSLRTVYWILNEMGKGERDALDHEYSLTSELHIRFLVRCSSLLLGRERDGHFIHTPQFYH